MKPSKGDKKNFSEERFPQEEGAGRRWRGCLDWTRCKRR